MDKPTKPLTPQDFEEPESRYPEQEAPYWMQKALGIDRVREAEK